ncbi:MAG: tetratricopeptide repeat protein [Spirochaetaceae bacterium]
MFATPIFIIPIVVALSALIIIFVAFSSKNKQGSSKKNNKLHQKDSATRVKEAQKRLTQNPKDAEALQIVAENHFNEGRYDKAMRTYELLIELCATNKELDEFDFTLKYALSALKMKNYKEAYKSLAYCRSQKQDVFEVNFNLGYLEYARKNYEKAFKLFSQAKEAQPEHPQTLKYLGMTALKLLNYKDAASNLRKAMDMDPEDKEGLYALGQAYHNLGQNEYAIKVFTHLRGDPNIGPMASLYAGTMHLNMQQYDKAVLDFSIGLRHENMKQETKLELNYRLATTYIKQQKIPEALNLLEEIKAIQPNYRDVDSLIKSYGELNRNQQLKTYLLAPTSDFVALCRKIVKTYFLKANVKISDISMHKNEYADILTEISTPKWEDVVLFRFMRTTSQVGDIVLRELYAKIKEERAGRGFCITAGKFSESAQQFVEARLIDLVEKDELLKQMKEVEKRKLI